VAWENVSERPRILGKEWMVGEYPRYIWIPESDIGGFAQTGAMHKNVGGHPPRWRSVRENLSMRVRTMQYVHEGRLRASPTLPIPAVFAAQLRGPLLPKIRNAESAACH
jgi:hypothetical protein